MYENGYMTKEARIQEINKKCDRYNDYYGIILRPSKNNTTKN